MISDLVLLILDRVRSYVDIFRDQGYVEYDQQQVIELSRRIGQVTASSAAKQQQLIAEIIRELDPSVVIDARPVWKWKPWLGGTRDHIVLFFARFS